MTRIDGFSQLPDIAPHYSFIFAFFALNTVHAEDKATDFGVAENEEHNMMTRQVKLLIHGHDNRT